MRCAWKELLSILPLSFREEVDKLGKLSGQEIRLICGQPGLLVTKETVCILKHTVKYDDLLYVINTASRYSPWTAQSISKGYLTAPGGHRIGICGQAVVDQGNMTGISTPSSLCIRIARDLIGIAEGIPADIGSALIIGPPGAGKTTLLRDLIRKSRDFICVVDEKGEIFPIFRNENVFEAGNRVHILSGTSKIQGIEAVLRNMGPKVIAVDEITAQEDCQALCSAAWCGVRLIATAHAENKEGLYRRTVYKPLIQTGLFESLIVLRRDQSWYLERMDQ